MPSTKIPTPSSVRRALTTLKRGGYIDSVIPRIEDGTSLILLVIDNNLLTSKKTSKRKPKHKKVEHANKD